MVFDDPVTVPSDRGFVMEFKAEVYDITEWIEMGDATDQYAVKIDVQDQCYADTTPLIGNTAWSANTPYTAHLDPPIEGNLQFKEAGLIWLYSSPAPPPVYLGSTVSLPADGASQVQAVVPGETGYTFQFESNTTDAKIDGSSGIVTAGRRSGSAIVKGTRSGQACVLRGYITFGCGDSGGGCSASSCGPPPPVWHSSSSSEEVSFRAPEPPGWERTNLRTDSAGNVSFMWQHRNPLTGEVDAYDFGETPHLRVTGTGGTLTVEVTPPMIAAPASTVLIDEQGRVAQEWTPEGLYVYAYTATTTTIDFYPPSQVTGPTGDGSWGITGLPARSDTFALNTAATQLTISRTSGGTTTTETAAVISGGIQFTRGNQISKHTGSTPGANLRDEISETLESTTLAARTAKRYQTFAWGEELIQETNGSGGDAETTTYTYYTNSGTDGNNYGHVKQIDYPDKRWVIFEYNANDTISREYHSIGTYSPNTTDSTSMTVEYSYTTFGSDAGGLAVSPRTITTKYKGQVIKKIGRIIEANQDTSIEFVSPSAAYTDGANLKTVTKFYSTGEYLGRPQFVAHPDGTLTHYEYAHSGDLDDPASATDFTVTEWKGEPNVGGTAVVSGTKTVTVTGRNKAPISRRVYDVASNAKIEETVYTYANDLKTEYTVEYLDGTEFDVVAACCGSSTVIDRDGATVQTFGDALGRQLAVLKYGILSSNTFDAADRILMTQRISGASSDTPFQAQYLTSGKVSRETNALGGVTQYVRTINGSNQPVDTTTYPDTSTEVRTYFRDGRLDKVTGAASRPRRYVYDVESDGGVQRFYTKEILLNAAGSDTSEWTKRYEDMFGRVYKTVFADSTTGTETDNPKHQSFFNNKGQLEKEVDPDGVTTLFVYNAEGGMERTVIDMNGNGSEDLGGTDRITKRVSSIVSAHSANVRREDTYVYGEGGSSTATLIARNETSVDGLHSWSQIVTNFSGGVAYGPVTERETVPGATKTETVIAPNGARTVQEFYQGRLVSVTEKDSATNQVTKMTVDAYDAFGRRWKVSDARNGTTVYAYNGMDQAVTVTTPTPGNGQAAQTTVTDYDSSGRAWKITLPDGTAKTNEFYAGGNLKKTSGSRVYPVMYDYDAQGRMISMTTWTNLTANTGKATTAWNFNAYRGYLDNKRYTNGIGPDYTYTAGGRLSTRAWARGSPRVTTTSFYNAAGDLEKIHYNDSITFGVTNYFDRRGRIQSVYHAGMLSSNIYHFGGGLLVQTNIGGILDTISVTNAYDGYLRQSAVAVYGKPTTLNAYTYDAANRLATVGDGTHSATYSYIANSHLIGDIVYKEYTTPRMTAVRKYDRMNRLQSIVSTPAGANELPLAYHYRYNDANQRIRVNSSDAYWVYQYDALGQVISGKRFWNDGTPVAGQQYEYAFDDIGNRNSTSFGGDETGADLRTAAYTNSVLNQLTGRRFPGYVETLGAATNGSTVTVNGLATHRKGEYFRKELSVANSNVFHLGITVLATAGSNAETNSGSVVMPPAIQTFSYDSDGNMTGDSLWTYVWDAENRLIEVLPLTNSPAASKHWLKFAYDSEGRRIQKTSLRWNTNTTSWYILSSNCFAYTSWNTLATFQSSDKAVVHGYVWGQDLSGSRKGSGGVGGLIAVNVANGTHFATSDGNGNVAGLVTAAAGKSSAAYEYDPFLLPVRASGEMAHLNPWQGSTRFSDTEIGMLYYGYRYYTPSTGRWASRDPLGEADSNNLYLFVNNRPNQKIDILGLLTWVDEANTSIQGERVYWPINTAFHGDVGTGRAITVPRMVMTFNCCGCFSNWKLCKEGITIKYHAETTYHPSVSSMPNDFQAWLGRAEGDHVADFNAWAKNTAKPLAQTTETGLFSQSWWTAAGCGTGVRDAIANALIASARGEITATIARWDTPGKHTWENANRRP